MYSWENLSTESNYRGDMDAEKRQYYATKCFVTVGKMTKGNEKEAVFENPKNDFPTKISYTKITNDSIVAAISGIQNGKEKSELFSMKKSK